MKVAYIILAFKNPVQLRLLVQHLNHTDHFFFIHLDKRVELIPFKKELKEYEKKIIWVKREVSYWGSYQCVKALINGLRLSYEYQDVRFDYFIHLSGQDFPLKSPQFINQTLAQNSPTNFLNLIPFPVATWDKGGIDRIKNVKLFWKGKRIILHPGVKNWILKSFYSLIYIFFRFLDKNKSFFGGEFYFMLHRTGVERLLSNIGKYPIFFNRLKYVTLPEEIIIHTMLMIDNNANYLRTSKDKFRFIDWSKNQKSPKEMGEQEILDLLKSSYLFARKFTISDPQFKVNFNE